MFSPPFLTDIMFAVYQERVFDLVRQQYDKERLLSALKLETGDQNMPAASDQVQAMA